MLVGGGMRMKPQATVLGKSRDNSATIGETLTVCRARNPAESLWLLADTQQAGGATNQALFPRAESPSTNTQRDNATPPLYLHLPQTKKSPAVLKGMGFTNMHYIGFFPSSCPFLQSAFWGDQFNQI